MTTRLIFTVHGEPAPQGSKRHVGNGVMIESSKKVKPWRQDVVAAARAAICANGPELALDPADGVWRKVDATQLWQPIDAPVRLTVIFTLRKPASAPKRKRTYPMRVPDLSKLVRATEDALTTAGVWKDDARVVEIIALKVYPGEHPDALDSGTGARIKVEVVE